METREEFINFFLFILGTTDAIFIVRQMQGSLELKERSSILALWIWKKLLIEFREK